MVVRTAQTVCVSHRLVAAVGTDVEPLRLPQPLQKLPPAEVEEVAARGVGPGREGLLVSSVGLTAEEDVRDESDSDNDVDRVGADESTIDA